MDAVPFRRFGLLASYEGLVRRDGDQLCVEYRMADGFVGLLKGGVREVRIPLADLASAELVEPDAGDPRLVLQARQMAAVEGLPGATDGRVELLIDRSHREAAARLVAGLPKPDAAPGVGPDA